MKALILLLISSCSMNPTGLRSFDIEKHTLVNQVGFICPKGYYLNAMDYKCHIISKALNSQNKSTSCLLEEICTK